MTKKINAIVILQANKIELRIMETFEKRIFQIYSSSCDEDSKYSKFISESIMQVNKKFSLNIKEIVFVILIAKGIKLNLEKRFSTIEVNGKISLEHIEKSIKIEKDSLKQNDQVAILSRPYKYEVLSKNDQIATFNEVPLDIEAKELKTYSVVSHISSSIYNYIINLCENANITLKTIVTDSHLNQYLLDNNSFLIENKEKSLININEESVTINIYNNNVLIDYHILSFGTKYIYEKIFKNHDSITSEEAKKIFSIYTDFNKFNSEKQVALNSNLTLKKLNQYTLLFFEKIFEEFNKKFSLVSRDTIYLTGEGSSILDLEKIINSNFEKNGIDTKCHVNSFITYQLLNEEKNSYMATKYINSMIDTKMENNFLITKPLKILQTYEFISNTSENYLIS
ncbi:hypothetical protein [[Mycoplasma] mobile]|uniref:Expressed protein n=1 Tax=Mycoplasma mobile (strain ATCC 43663 / 163K / NCTC 11711) TaxID=267748 RepID=Q6KHR1_MYCM1|nr:hypothetical protein [[Mycoplasma] mobile]AAT27867.1 expressed protein [Mycoplasma mobile 163K]